MRLPVPNNRLVAFTLVGALLTTLVAGGLAFPGLGQRADPVSDGITGPPEVGADAPTPNQDFTPAVQTQSGDDEDHEEEYEEHEAEDSEGHEEDEEA